MSTPQEESAKVEKIVIQGNMRKYKGFRLAPFYNNCASADAIGCNLTSCFACWTNKSNINPEKYGKFYTPDEVVDNLFSLNCNNNRITSGEPLVGLQHFMNVIDRFATKITTLHSNVVKKFIIETNGTLLTEDVVKFLMSYVGIIHVRLSFKGINRVTFIDNAAKDWFDYQLNALGLLIKYNIPYHIALLNIYTSDEIDDFLDLIRYGKEISYKDTGVKKSSKLINNIELEKPVFYPFVKERLKLDERYINIRKRLIKCNLLSTK